MIVGEDLRVRLGDSVIIDGVSIRIPDSGTLGLVGPNGSGKTTLLRTLYGALTPDAGTVQVDERPLRGYPRKQLARRLAVVVQENPGELPMSVADLVMLGRLPHQGFTAQHTKEDERVVGAALAKVGVAHLARRNVQDLSGGERQRVMIARALAQGADHILLDEPTNHLDIRSREWLEQAIDEFDGTLLLVSHDRYFLEKFANRIWSVEHGGIIDFDGGYSEYREVSAALRQQRESNAPIKQPEPKKEPEEKPAQKRNRETDALRKRIPIIENRIAGIEEEMKKIDEELIEASSDHIRLGELLVEREKAEQRIDALMAEWADIMEALGE